MHRLASTGHCGQTALRGRATHRGGDECGSDGVARTKTTVRAIPKAVLASFGQLADDRPVAMHPFVARSVGSDVFETMLVDQGERA